MDNHNVLVTLSLKNQLSFIQTACQNPHVSVEELLETLSLEECREILLNSVKATDIKSITIDAFTIDALVKNVIDNFDLYVLLPGIDAPHSEYDIESRRIAENITYGMSVREIATLIKDVFDYYFDAQYNIDVYTEPAKQIHTYLNLLHDDKPRCYIIKP